MFPKRKFSDNFKARTHKSGKSKSDGDKVDEKTQAVNDSNLNASLSSYRKALFACLGAYDAVRNQLEKMTKLSGIRYNELVFRGEQLQQKAKNYKTTSPQDSNPITQNTIVATGMHKSANNLQDLNAEAINDAVAEKNAAAIIGGGSTIKETIQDYLTQFGKNTPPENMVGKNKIQQSSSKQGKEFTTNRYALGIIPKLELPVGKIKTNLEKVSKDISEMIVESKNNFINKRQPTTDQSEETTKNLRIITKDGELVVDWVDSTLEDGSLVEGSLIENSTSSDGTSGSTDLSDS